ncbi:hypothetical protein [Nocardioides sp. Kera G14]|uniref:hypothetical protein n=1 Tax=Nocardioides sp. Kera G14 TaxID=2884264 RepID=UPI001D0FA49B|nr:hypothetical protein [Nocardioides sp. Kera G14]UDY22388.1 hypothetical protein LH076_09880 [Nocardioides sp. Kera G14]
MTTIDRTPIPGFYACPDWCMDPDPLHDLKEAADGGRIHYSPAGSAHLAISHDDGVRNWYAEVHDFIVDTSSSTETATELRRLASELNAAAEWLEARQ